MTEIVKLTNFHVTVRKRNTSFFKYRKGTVGDLSLLPTRKNHSLCTALYAVSVAMYRNANCKVWYWFWH